MHIYIFSYNRGIFLENCLLSVRDCAPQYKVTVIDDKSSDYSTLEVINKWRNTYEVISPRRSKHTYKTGGLYNNMNYAMDHAAINKNTFALFLQDDMQLIRKITKSDMSDIHDFYLYNKNVIQYDTNFMKFHTTPDNLYVDGSGKGYLKPLNLDYSGFTALGVFHVDRFFRMFGEFKSTERLNDEYARSNGIQRGYARNPFMMWLPNPISHRGKKRSLWLRVIEKISRAGFYPYTYMSPSEASSFLKRKITEFPVAEDYLDCPGLTKKKKWAFVGGRSALYEQGGWRRIVGRVMKRVEF